MNNINERITLANELLEIPKQISTFQNSIVADNSKLNAIDHDILSIESEIKQDINNETDSSGKKVYTNGDLRDAAFLSICKNHSDLNEKYKERNAVQVSIQNSKIEAESLNNHQRNIRAILYTFGGVSVGE